MRGAAKILYAVSIGIMTGGTRCELYRSKFIVKSILVANFSVCFNFLRRDSMSGTFCCLVCGWRASTLEAVEWHETKKHPIGVVEMTRTIKTGGTK